MPQSGKKASPKKPTRAKSTKSSPPTGLAASPSESSTALLSPAEARVARALHRYKIDRKTWEASPEITPIIWRTMGNQKKAMEVLRFSEDDQVRLLLEIFWAQSI